MFNAATELFDLGAYHFLRLKSLIPSHVSSIHMNRVLGGYDNNAITHLYLNIKLLLLLPPTGI